MRVLYINSFLKSRARNLAVVLLVFLFEFNCLGDTAVKEGRGGNLSAKTGYSLKSSPDEAAAEAAEGITKQIKASDIKLVLVFDSFRQDIEGEKRMLEKLSFFFDKDIVFGCSGFGPISKSKADPTVVLAALAGDIDVRTAISRIDKEDYDACGKKLAGSLKAVPAQTKRGNENKAAFLLGDCHVPDNDKLVKSFEKEMQDAGMFVFGGAHPRDGVLYYKGEVYQRHNMALLLEGDFICEAKITGGGEKEQILINTQSTISETRKSHESLPVLTLVFDCVLRRNTLGEQRKRYFNMWKTNFENGAIAGFFGSGEIGREGGKSYSTGVGGQASICTFFNENHKGK